MNLASSQNRSAPWWLAWLPLGAAALCAWWLWRAPYERTQAGVEAYLAGDAATAVEYFQEALAIQESPSLWKNLALAALANEDWEQVDAALAGLVASGNQEDLAWRDFLLGNAAWRQSERAEAQANGPIPPAGALERAIALTESAREAWLAAEEGRESWKEADANVALADERLAYLQEIAALDPGGPETKKLPPPPPPVEPEREDEMMQQLERMKKQQVPEQTPPTKVLDW
jgi:hypothetical protein